MVTNHAYIPIAVFQLASLLVQAILISINLGFLEGTVYVFVDLIGSVVT